MIRALAAALLVVALAGCTSNPDPAPSTDGPTPGVTPSATVDPTPDTSTPTPAVTGTPVDPVLYATGDDRTIAFSSPTGNLQCVYSAYRDHEAWGCVARELTATLPPSDDDCATTTGFWVGVANGSFTPEPACFGLGDGPAVPYGSSITYLDMACDSTEDGMRCSSLTSGHGFRLSRSDYELF